MHREACIGEIALIKLCRPAMETTQDALTDRVAQLEKVEEGVTVVAAAPAVRTCFRSSAPPHHGRKNRRRCVIPDDIRQVVKTGVRCA